MYSKSTAHMRSNGSHFLTVGLFMYWTYKVKKNFFNRELGYYRVVLLKGTMHSKVRLLFI